MECNLAIKAKNYNTATTQMNLKNMLSEKKSQLQKTTYKRNLFM